ncbi:hypothetical protein [Streptomyces ardesiacus]|uniref:hypothetical protein n=1 Tax=Streptomyces ardesiacus TaxID=285564 RepID=UPI000D5A0756|nr:hypothetical protein [Streptomyces ardesiacus]
MAIRTVRKGGSRFYVNPETRISYPGVTSILGMQPKTFLGYWRSKMTAELAVKSFPFLQEMVETAGEEAAVAYLKGAADRYTKARASIGSEAHDIFERIIRGDTYYTKRDPFEPTRFLNSLRKDLEPYRANFIEFMEMVQPEMVSAEDIAWSDTHQYAGSYDVILRVRLSKDAKGNLYADPVNGAWYLIIGDWKTSKDTYPDVALQMSAYAHADKLIAPDGTERPVPEFDGAAVLHITDTKWSFKPVDAGADVFQYFLALRKYFDWDREVSKTVIGRPLAQGGRLTTGTERRK